MATKKSERIGSVVVLFVLLIGAFGSYAAMGLSASNKSATSTDTAAQYKAYLEQQKAAGELNAANSEAFTGYAARAFDANSVKSLSIEVLAEGTGAAVAETDTINVSYFGWTSDGKIFDSSKKLSTDDAPISFALSGVIKGWTQGITGQKVGSVIRLTIPSDLAYGSSGSGLIPADAPLEFIVQIHSIEAAAVTAS